MGAILQGLARFVRAKDVDGEREEIRAYVLANAADLAEAFGISEDTFRAGIERVDDDARLAARLLAEVKRAAKENRTARAAERVRTAQESADTLGSFASWAGDAAHVDVVSLLASVLTSRADSIVFMADAFTVSIPMDRLFDLARLERFDLLAWVDAKGLHVRWASGGLNFRTVKPDPKGATIYVHLPPRAAARAA